MTLHFPDGFIWGTATAAFQIEGAAAEDGRTPCIWDAHLHEHGYRGDDGDVAADHYHRWEEDLDLVARLGAQAYRFSASWSRVMPDGRTVNETGLDFYRRLVDGLLERGVAPALTMYHMDLPALFEGGWASRDTALRFSDYAQVLTEALGDRVPLWMTVNELYYESWLGYCEGAFPPGLRDRGLGVAALHHMLLAHGLGVDAVRRNVPNSEVGLVTGYAPTVPASAHPDDVAAAERTHVHSNGAVLDPVLRGAYPEDYRTHPMRAAALADVVREGDLATIGSRVDFVGLNYYFRRHIVASDRTGAPEIAATMDPMGDWLVLDHLHDIGVTEVRPKFEGRTMAGWKPEPEGMRQMLTEVTEQYGPVPIFVTENGLPLPDYVAPDGRVNDVERIAYTEQHLAAAHAALRAGARLRGYFHWSLMDNLEWTSGYGHRFGLVHVDYATQRRTPKASFDWYAGVVAGNRLPSPPDPSAGAPAARPHTQAPTPHARRDRQ